MRHENRPLQILLSCVALLGALVSGCGGGGGGGGGAPAIRRESEPNDTPATADALVLGRPAVGDLATPGDLDLYSIALGAGGYLRVELLAARSDQATWDASGNVPRLALLGPDGTTTVLEHDPDATVSDGWGWGRHDLDFPLFRVAANGTYFLRLAQADPALPGGSYALRASAVSLPAATVEFEPPGTIGANDTPNTSQDVQPGVVRGFHAEGDLDYYAITVAQRSVVRFEVHAYREGVHDGDDGYFDPLLQLFAPDGLTPLAIDDDTFFFDPAVQYEIEGPGTYFLEVGECCGVGDAEYLVTFARAAVASPSETEPNDAPAQADAIAYGGSAAGAIDAGETDLFAFAGTAGDMVRVQLFDGWNREDGGDFASIEVLAPDGATALPTGGFQELQTATTILREDGTHYLRVTPLGGPTEYRIELARFAAAEEESEPNDAIATAGDLEPRASGAIGTPGDVDVFRFDAPQDRLAVVAVYAGRAATGSDGAFEYSGHGSDLQPLLVVTDAGGNVLATSTSDPVSVFTESVTDPLPTAALAFVPSSGGPFFARVESAFGAGDAAQTYVLERR